MRAEQGEYLGGFCKNPGERWWPGVPGEGESGELGDGLETRGEEGCFKDVCSISSPMDHMLLPEVGVSCPLMLGKEPIMHFRPTDPTAHARGPSDTAVQPDVGIFPPGLRLLLEAFPQCETPPTSLGSGPRSLGRPWPECT